MSSRSTRCGECDQLLDNLRLYARLCTRLVFVRSVDLQQELQLTTFLHYSSRFTPLRFLSARSTRLCEPLSCSCGALFADLQLTDSSEYTTATMSASDETAVVSCSPAELENETRAGAGELS